jgi:hypothetical protein
MHDLHTADPLGSQVIPYPVSARLHDIWISAGGAPQHRFFPARTFPHDLPDWQNGHGDPIMESVYVPLFSV